MGDLPYMESMGLQFWLEPEGGHADARLKRQGHLP